MVRLDTQGVFQEAKFSDGSTERSTDPSIMASTANTYDVDGLLPFFYFFSQTLRLLFTSLPPRHGGIKPVFKRGLLLNENRVSPN